MDKDFDIKLEGTTLTVELKNELTKRNASNLQQLLSDYLGRDIQRIVFDATDLVFISSSGVRVIIFARQKLGDKPEIVFVNCPQEILDTFGITGLDRFITFVEDERMQKTDDLASVKNESKKRLAEIRQEELDEFATKNDVVCYQMKLGVEEEGQEN